MSCRVCKSPDTDLRGGVCFDCATAGDLRLARRSVMQHWRHGVRALFGGVWWMAKMDFRMGWERWRRTGEYAAGREWENY